MWCRQIRKNLSVEHLVEQKCHFFELLSKSLFSPITNRATVAFVGRSIFDRIQSNDLDVVGGKVRVTVGRRELPDPEMLLGEVEKPFFDFAFVLEIVADFVSQQNRAAFE